MQYNNTYSVPLYSKGLVPGPTEDTKIQGCSNPWSKRMQFDEHSRSSVSTGLAPADLILYWLIIRIRNLRANCNTHTSPPSTHAD